jgi:hypothetical protein
MSGAGTSVASTLGTANSSADERLFSGRASGFGMIAGDDGQSWSEVRARGLEHKPSMEAADCPCILTAFGCLNAGFPASRSDPKTKSESG